MFDIDTIDKVLYSEMMDQIKHINARQMQDIRRNQNIKKLRQYVRNRDFLTVAGATWRYSKRQMSQKNQITTPNYFSTEKVAVYTVITGDYDNVLEPYCKPDNCDYFLYTDKDFNDSASTWKKRELPSCLDGLSDVVKNRYLKMHPHELFGEYNYSVYVDGNIQIFTDLTEYINRLGPIGIGTHLHPDRQCVYKELETVLALGKETRDNAERHADHLERTGMPHNYGLLECNVIARAHHNKICVRIMEQWWQEFMEYSKRDQVSLPHVLYQNDIQVNEVGVLGENVRVNPSFRIFGHTEGSPSEGAR